MPATRSQPPAKPPRKSQKGQWTAGALAAKAQVRAAEAERLEKAAAYARANGYGARKAITEGKFTDLTIDKLHRHLNGKTKASRNERCTYDILTDKEEQRLVEWVIGSARNMNAAQESQQGHVTEQVKKMLVARKAFNRKKKGSREAGCVPLTPAEKRLLDQPNAVLSHVWMQHFLAANPQLQMKAEKAEDAKRTKKQTEATVEHHFYGEAGLQAELLDAGVMDPVTKAIKDPRRVVGIDETPQMTDNNGVGPKPKALGVRGEQLARAASKNRETVSVCMAQDLSGFQYGPQLNVARKEWKASLTDCFEAPEWAHKFDDCIYTFDKMSTYLCMSKSEKGVQTEETLLEFLGSLDEQITARSTMDQAKGLPPIERPVVVLTDNHGSRFGDNVLAATAGTQAKFGIRLWFEESNVSQFLQWLDQINKAFHSSYNKMRKEYKLRHKAMYGEETDIGLNEFLEIFGGCKELDMEGMWFSWCTPQTIIGACRKVGLLGCRLDPTQIDRSQFVDRAPAEPVAEESPLPSIEEVNKTPPGMESGSLEAERVKRQRLSELASKMQARLAAPLDPAQVPGLMAPREAPLKKRQRDNSRVDMSEGGSATLRQLHQKRQATLAEREAERARIDAKHAAAADKKAAAVAAAEKLKAAFELCAQGCQCGGVPCPMAKMKLCPVCGDIKTQFCRKKACTGAAAPLLLMGPPDEATPLALPAPPAALPLPPLPVVTAEAL